MCRNCSGKSCRSIPGEGEELSLECPACDGEGCDECKDGWFTVDGCPNGFCRSVISTIELVELFEKGLPPVTGGVLNQSASFLNAAKFYNTQKLLAKEADSE